MQVTIRQIQEEMTHKGQTMLKYTIQYPEMTSVLFRRTAAMISRGYRAKAELYRQRLRRSLYFQAVRDAQHAKDKGYPFHPYEAFLSCTITFNQDCALSLYFDAYQFTGGAHGNTTRTSDTWDLPAGRRVTMARFFPIGAPYKAYAIAAVNAQISEQLQQNEALYFEDYEKNTARYFNVNSFFLRPEGLVVYYQQYQIAPYSSGIPEFLLPFGKEVHKPQCRGASAR